MKITKSSDVNQILKPEGTKVDYYLFDDFELHYNEQAPKTTQTWHHHEKISEVLYIIEGNLTVYWRENGGEFSQELEAGDLVHVENTPHTFENISDQVVKFIVLKRIASTENYREIFKNDKVID